MNAFMTTARAYELTRRGEFPCEVHRFGRIYRVKTSALLHALDSSG